MIMCNEFTAEIVGDDTNLPDLEVRVINRLKPQEPARIYRYPRPSVADAYRDDRGFLDFKGLCEDVVFHDAGCDQW